MEQKCPRTEKELPVLLLTKGASCQGRLAPLHRACLITCRQQENRQEVGQDICLPLLGQRQKVHSLVDIAFISTGLR